VTRTNQGDEEDAQFVSSDDPEPVQTSVSRPAEPSPTRLRRRRRLEFIHQVPDQPTLGMPRPTRSLCKKRGAFGQFQRFGWQVVGYSSGLLFRRKGAAQNLNLSDGRICR
jgi:hypothetical protein